MSDNLNINVTLQAWADIVIDRWEQKIQTLKINYSHQLYESFHNHVRAEADGNAAKIEFAFNYYGKFVDMGVGKGVKLEDRGTVTTRRPKKWYSSVFFTEIKKLGYILAEKYARKGAVTIIENIDDYTLMDKGKKV
jgi:hypothetical protein